MTVGNIVVILVNARIITIGGNIVVVLVNVRIITTGGNTNMIMILVDVDIIENVNVLSFVVIVIANIVKIIYHF
ncbi:hypothetical protein [Bacillus thuringiensis]|uniref:hypothetical protein n=1 Tax=Bacillus thuringiensis TaxID=1428 RepID=UPI0015CEF8C9|nr:hypothetical protein [Bacillus thuringiensis]